MVSIIVPVYNGEKYIINCADALISQSYKDIEIIFVNDGSADSTQDILNELKNKDQRIKVFHTKNGGVSSARNRGLSESSGEYIMFCDIDDTPHKDWCKELFECTKKFPNSLPICAARKVVANNTSVNMLYTLQQNKLIGKHTYFPKQYFFTLCKAGLLDTVWNKIFSAGLIKTNKIYFDETISNGEDNLFIYKYLAATQGNTVFLNEILYTYIEQNPNSLSKQLPYNKILTGETIFDAQKELLKKLDLFNNLDKSDFYNFHLNNFLLHLSNVITNNNYSRKERLKKSNVALNLPGFRECLFAVVPKTSCQGKLVRIYRSKILRWLYNFRLIYLTII